LRLRTRIIGTGSYLPGTSLDNFDIEKMIDTSDEWITERTGIKQRRVAKGNEGASGLGVKASKRALKSAGISAGKIDMVISATMSGDMVMPSTASFIQNKIGARNAAAFDLNAACSGFLYGLSVADSYIRSGSFQRILVVGTEVLSKLLNWKDRNTCVLFGDAAGAVVLDATKEKRGILSVHVHSNGSMWDLIQLPGSGSKRPYIRMKGNETFKVAVRTLEKLVIDTLKKNRVRPSELSLLIPHQANLRIIQATAKRLRLPMEKVFINLDRYGNTSSASIPVALDEALKGGRIHEGDYILLEAFGAGLTWASTLIKW
jgi:3-oxoacyl-[acyl-carrier-protein] synthase-3